MKDVIANMKEYLLSRRGSLTVCITVGALTVLICAGVLLQAAFSRESEPTPSEPTATAEPTEQTEETEPTAAPTEAQTSPTKAPTQGATGCAHTYERVVIREMTCTEAEEAKHVCTKCGKEMGPYITRPTEYHTVDGAEVPADCGYELYVGKTCDKCGTVMEEREDITHDFQTTTTPATCTEQGVTANTCRLCGYSEESVLPATGHNMLKYTFLLSSCRSAGYEEYRCSNCHAMERIELEKLPHEPSESTCDEGGECKKCGTVITEALGHDYVYGACTRCDSLEHRAEKTHGVLYQDTGIRNHFGGHSSWFTVYSAKEIILSESGLPVARFNVDISYFIAQAYWNPQTYDDVQFRQADLFFADGTDLSRHPEFIIGSELFTRKNQGVVSGYILVPLVGFGEYDFSVPTCSHKEGRITNSWTKGFILTVNDDVPGAELLKQYLDNQNMY